MPPTNSYNPYNFGLGKRADYYDEETYGENVADDPSDYEMQAIRAGKSNNNKRHCSTLLFSLI